MVLSPGAGIASAAGGLPPAPLHLTACDTYSPCHAGARRGVPSLPPAAPCLYLLSCPHPPDPLPLRGRGSPRLFHARGSAPCIPGAEPSAAREKRGEPYARQGGLPFLSPVCPDFSLLFCPHPPARARRALFPSGEGGAQGYFMQGAPPLASPGLNPRFAVKATGSSSL